MVHGGECLYSVLPLNGTSPPENIHTRIFSLGDYINKLNSLFQVAMVCCFDICWHFLKHGYDFSTEGETAKNEIEFLLLETNYTELA